METVRPEDAGGGGQPQTPWYEQLIPADVTIEQGGQQVPLRDHEFIKNSKDPVSFAKQALDAHREVGARIPIRVEKVRDDQGRFIPKRESVDAWRKDHLPKLYDAGVLDRPPASPDEYEFAAPEGLPEGYVFNDELAKEFKEILHKHGVPKAVAQDLINLQLKALGHTETTFAQNQDEVMKELQREHGDQFEFRRDMVKRIAPMIFRKAGELDMATKMGLLDNTGFLSFMMRLAPLAQSDSSFVREMSRTGGGGTMTREEVYAEVSKISSDTSHPMYKGYWSQDPAVMKHIDSLYAKLPGAGQTLNISEGVKVEGKS